MKIRLGVVGDIHGNYRGLKQAVREMGRIETLLFTGDGYREISRLQDETDIDIDFRIEGVVGNCDFCSLFPTEQILCFGRYRVLLTHGHLYGVKSDLTRLGMVGREQKADLVVFGHTHEALCDDWYEVKLFNPGSLSAERSYRGPSYGIIEISDAGINPVINRL
ncbi:MAG TPA: metallophosphoesterase [Firmicutes bacterium]|nr:metallophosphoesterase [Bacillota bacterium]